MPSTIIIGAGIAGLLAAELLTNAGLSVVIVEKSRGVGGRMATRRIENGIFDHGAQFFTVREPAFAARVTTWQARGLVVRWANGFATPTEGAKNDGHSRYRGKAGMTTVPKALANDLDLRLGANVRAVSRQARRWQIHLDSGETLLSRSVILTPPVPQSLGLLEAGRVKLPSPIAAALRAITYDPCIAVLALSKDAGAVPPPGGIQFQDGPIRWIADNHQKGISPGGFAVTIHASPAFSLANWDLEDWNIAGQLLAAAAHWIGGEIVDYQVHRWHFSQPREIYPAPCLEIPGPAPLIFAGDANGGPKIEGAAHSGLFAAESMLVRL